MGDAPLAELVITGFVAHRASTEHRAPSPFRLNKHRSVPSDGGARSLALDGWHSTMAREGMLVLLGGGLGHR